MENFFVVNGTKLVKTGEFTKDAGVWYERMDLYKNGEKVGSKLFSKKDIKKLIDKKGKK